jgi:excisionase family DNA binding protein
MDDERPGDSEIMTLQEVATYLKLAERTVYLYAQRGQLPGIKIGSAWRFRRADLDAWLDEQRRLTEAGTSGRRRKSVDKGGDE